MNILFAPDSFKGSLSAVRVCALLAEACGRHFPGAQTQCVPIADGGEGTVDALVATTGGHDEAVWVTGPMGDAVQARYGVLGDGRTAVLEVAQACGLPLVAPERRNPLLATSRGVGEMIAHVLQRGYRRLLVGLGGSATNDGGMGMLEALGVRFLDDAGEVLHGSGEAMGRVASIDTGDLLSTLSQAEITALTDVTNPLLGEQGATHVYGPQKGADMDRLPLLEAGMAHYAPLLEAAFGRPVRDLPGAGAAGGLGAALPMVGASLQSGASAVLDAINFDSRLASADLVITGEGSFDAQSVRYGKGPMGVVRRCAARGVPVIVMAGGVGEGAQALYTQADACIMPVLPRPMSLSQALADADAIFADAADRVFRLLKMGGRLRG